jgi:hypothetical protein
LLHDCQPAISSLQSMLHLIPLYLFDIAILMCGVIELQVAAYTTFRVVNLYNTSCLPYETQVKHCFMVTANELFDCAQ